MAKRTGSGFGRGKKSNSKVMKTKLSMTLTQSGSDLLARMAKQAGVTKSELVDRIARGEIAIASPVAELTISLAGASSPNDTQISAVRAAEQPGPPVVEPQLAGSGAVISAEDSGEIALQLAEMQQQLSQQHTIATQNEHEVRLKTERIAELEQQLAQQQVQSERRGRDEAIAQRELAQLATRITELEQEVTAREAVGASAEQSPVGDRATIAQQARTIAALHQQVVAEQDRRSNCSAQMERLEQEHDRLHRDLNTAQVKIQELQREAIFGAHVLGKWRR
ncbi:hypothetical protein KR51_00012660 [Rubidibacter lacunae KORDI 51-2]|uniref:Ribbon-helix-helix protein, copG family n=1 Tax=Rubidibacter lacunae KORDI 51-2 TaxID=582515 RepID=U5DQH4_9CHRO|nr:hypothetical protein [Rubidibacter lacunae]ERN41940.1 hypothetical protein KR51_00012660 [Rubidibacter lacunae KORDI 51-2]